MHSHQAGHEIRVETRQPQWRTLATILIAMLIWGASTMASTVASAADGAALYKAQCARCHGADGSAEGPVAKAMKVPALKDPHHDSAEVTKHVREAKNHAMPSGKLDDSELEAVAAFVASL